MIDHMREPSGGQDVSATQIREIIRAVRANRLVAGPNIRLKWTPNGTVVSATSAPSQQRTPLDRTRFAIESISETTPASPGSTLTVKFRNPYYNLADRTFVMALESAVATAPKTGHAFVALQVVNSPGGPIASVVTYQSMSEMQDAQQDFSKVVIPLYKFTDGSIECDFRIGPSSQTWEFQQ